MGATIIDFQTKRNIMADEGTLTLSKPELLTNIITMLQDEADNIDELVVGYFDKEGTFHGHSNVNDGGAILWIIEQLKLGVLGVL